jgi:hypothetical protein
VDVDSGYFGIDGIAVAVGDLNGDGLPDIIASAGDQAVSFLLQTGDGGFAPADTIE